MLTPVIDAPQSQIHSGYEKVVQCKFYLDTGLKERHVLFTYPPFYHLLIIR